MALYFLQVFIDFTFSSFEFYSKMKMQNTSFIEITKIRHLIFSITIMIITPSATHCLRHVLSTAAV